MVCLYCSAKTTVSNSRLQKRLNQVWRRRHCTKCGAVFSTLEAADLSSSLVVIQKGGSLAPYRRDELFLSLHRSLGHRRDAVDAANAITATVTAELLASAQNASTTPKTIITIAYQTLSHFDMAAATHYKAYHQTHP